MINSLQLALNKLKKLTLGQELALLFFVLLLILIPVTAYLALTKTDLRNFANEPITSPITPPGSPTPRPPKITEWKTPYAAILTSNLKIQTGGKSYNIDKGTLKLNSSPTSFYDGVYHTTLEATWIENRVEMRLFFYFQSDGSRWWVSEMRTYDGQKQPNWIYYYPDFSAPLRSNYSHVGNIDIYSKNSDTNRSGTVHFENMLMTAFWNGLSITPAALGNAFLSFQKATFTNGLKNNLSIPLIVDTAGNNVTATDIYVNYDSTRLKPVSVVNSTFFPTVLSDFLPNRVYVTGLVNSPEQIVNGRGKVASIVFKPLQKGYTAVTFDCKSGATETSKIIKNDVNATNIINCFLIKAATVRIR